MAFTAGTFPTYTAFNALPRGVMGVTVGTATTYTNATGTYTQLTCSAGAGPSQVLTLSTSRKYRARFTGRFLNLTGTYALIGFHEGATLRDAWQFQMAAVATTLKAEWIFTPASGGAVSYAIYVALNGSGTIAASAAADTPMVFTIEDIGLA